MHNNSDSNRTYVGCANCNDIVQLYLFNFDDLSEELLHMICFQRTRNEILMYRKLSNTRRTKSKNLHDSRLVLHLSLPNLMKPGVK